MGALYNQTIQNHDGNHNFEPEGKKDRRNMNTGKKFSEHK